jgi:hypothetical protein
MRHRPNRVYETLVPASGVLPVCLDAAERREGPSPALALEGMVWIDVIAVVPQSRD